MKIMVPVDGTVDAEVDLWKARDACFLQARFNVSLPGLERQVAEALVDAAHQTCPYSKPHAATSMCIQLERDH